MRFIAAGLLVAAAMILTPAVSTPARADLKICNNSGSRVGIALGYKDTKGWASEGWWNIDPKACETLLEGDLIARYYYIYAVDYDKGGSWGGEAILCSRDKLFTIRGYGSGDNLHLQPCKERGFQRTGYFEVDTGEEPDWTVSLSGDKTEGPSSQ